MASIIPGLVCEPVGAAIGAAVLAEGGRPSVVAAHPTPRRNGSTRSCPCSVALGSRKPSANVAIARGRSPASGRKRVDTARELGLLPETEPGRTSAGLSAFDVTARTRGR